MHALVSKFVSRDALPLGVAAGALAAFALGLLGTLYPFFDMLAQFSLHWLIIALAALAASAARSRAYAILTAGLATALLLPVALSAAHTSGGLTATANAAALPAGAAGPAAERPRHFKLLTYNLYNRNTDLDAIWHEIDRHDADVVVLLEFGPNKRALRQRLAARYPNHRACDRDWDCAIGVFSRLPVDRFRLVGPRDDDGPPLIAADVVLGARAVRVIATHVLSPNHGPRANFIELDRLARVVRQSPLPVVVAGDLNTTLWANAFDNFRRRSGLRHMGALIPTWPVQPVALPQLGIDHIFLSPELRLYDLSAGASGGSDHLPLVATVWLGSAHK